MLYLNPPFFEYEGVVVGRDYSDPLQFWYYPNRPHLATDEHDRPVIRFLTYREDLDEIEGGDDVGAGFLFFDTVLSYPAETLDKVAGRLKQDLDLDGEPRLTPLQLKEGKVRLSFLDRISGPPPANPQDGDPPSEDWVTTLESAGIPSLYGENRAMFSVAMTKKAAALLLGSFDGFIPAGVVYELTYIAMQRAFEVKVEVDWSVVYHFVQNHESDRFIFWSSDSEDIVAKLEEKKIIKITSSLEGVGDEGMQGEFEEVRKQLTQFVFEKFFEPKINPKALLDKDVPDGILALLAGAPAAANPLQFGRTKRTLDDTELRSLSIDYTTYKAVERVIAPQGHLSVFWEDFAPAITKEDVVTVVTGDDDLWRQVEFRVLASAKFDAQHVDKIVVDVAYGEMDGDEPAIDADRDSVVLDSTHPDAAIRNWYDPAIGTTVHYRYTVALGPDAVVGDKVVLVSDWLQAADGIVPINPQQLYEERSVEFQRSALLPKDLFPEVLVHLRYVEPDTGWTHHTSGLLKAEGQSWEPEFRIPADAPRRLDYRCEFQRAAADPLDTGWLSTEEDMVVVNDPRENLFPVRVLVADRTDFEQVLVDLAYDDPEHGVHETGSMTISKDNVNDQHQWVFQRADADRTRYRYNQVLIGADGSVVAPGWVQSADSTLLVGKVYASRSSVQPEVVGPPLSSQGLEKIVVTVDYDDPGHSYHVHSEQEFFDPGRGEPIALELRDPTLRGYRYTIRYVQTNGFDHRVGPVNGTDTFLVIPSTPPAA